MKSQQAGRHFPFVVCTRVSHVVAGCNMNLSDTTSPEATPQKQQKRSGESFGGSQLNLSFDSSQSVSQQNDQQALRDENDALRRTNEELRRKLRKLKKRKKCVPNSHIKPWSQLSTKRKYQVVTGIQTGLQEVADKYSTSVIAVSANIMYRKAMSLNKRDIARIAKKIEANVPLGKTGQMSTLVASWMMLRGKSGGLSKVVYLQMKKVLHLFEGNKFH